jgi:hypothetical protein
MNEKEYINGREEFVANNEEEIIKIIKERINDDRLNKYKFKFVNLNNKV